MSETLFRTIVVACIILVLLIRLPYTKKEIDNSRIYFKIFFLIILFIYLFTDWFHFALIDLPFLFRLIGVIIVIPGLLLLKESHKTLGKYWSSLINLKIHKNHKLITSGVYEKIRHPIYSSQLLIFLGLAIIISNWFITLLIFVPLILVFIYGIPREEKLMINKFGKSYKIYMKRTSRFFPKILKTTTFKSPFISLLIIAE